MLVAVNFFFIAKVCGGNNGGIDPVSQTEYAGGTAADSLSFKAQLTRKLDSLCTADLFIQSQLGLMVYDLDDNRTLYTLGERQLLRPASTMKLLTAITALDWLGKDYNYRTELFISGNITNGVLYGDIYVRGTMDPTLESADIDSLAASISALEIDTIHGNIVADRSFMDSPPLGKGWCWDDDNPALTPLVYEKKDNMTEVLRRRIAGKGIVITGNNTTGTVPSDAVSLAIRRTKLTSVLTTMLKQSNNLYAESVLYNIAGKTRKPATASEAQARERELLRIIGLNADDYCLADGSGLSYYNLLSAECEVYLLRYAYNNFFIFGTLYDCLPRAGVDGTLKWRMRNSPAEDNVRAKTGTLTGVSTLAGYCLSPEGHMLAFAILNQGVMQRWRAHAFQDAVCQAMCR